MERFASVAEFKRLAKVGRDAGAGIALASVGMRAVNAAARTAVFVFSDQSIDRMGDRVMADGWRLASYKRNPIALWGHLSQTLPVGKTVDVRIEGPRLIGTIKFVPPEIDPFADRIFRMAAGGFIQACSVGFRPLRWAWAKEPDRSRAGGIDFLEQELLEISLVTIPANAAALLVGAGAEADKQRAQAARRRQLRLLKLSAP